jgi:hypothetical protein
VAPSNRNRTRRLGLLLILIALVRIIATYHVFSETTDEPSNLANGLQIIQHRVYYMDVKHPPLARLAIALGPYLAGLRLSGPGRGIGNELGNEVLNSNGQYWRNLTLARLGILPFFVLGCAVVWIWSRDLFGKQAALFSLLFFTLLPTILAHSGNSTNDLPAAATIALALYTLCLWVAKPGWPTAAALGLGAGLALVTKFSAVLFLPACAAALLLLLLARGDYGLRGQSLRKSAAHLLAALSIAFLVFWAGYLFTTFPLQSPGQQTAVDRVLGRYPLLHKAVDTILETPLPAGRAVAGVAGIAGQNKAGQVSFFLGEWRRHGWWYFFPFMLLVKTPIPFLLFSAYGGALLIVFFLRKRDWRKLAPLVFAGTILIASMTSGINIGVRHVLAVYPLLAIVAGYAAHELWTTARRPALARALVLAGCLAMVVSSALAQPDYLAYFNVFGSRHPERIEVDSDLDWGQDLARLSTWLHARGAQDLAISYFGTADLTHAGLPPYRELEPYKKVSGWVAISARNLAIPTPFLAEPQTEGIATFYSIPGNFTRIKPANGPFSWLQAYSPVARIGYSMFIYNIPPLPSEAH